MAYSEGQLDGAADYRCGINIYLVSQDYSGNTSTFYWEVILQNPTGSPSWASNPGIFSWSASVGGQGRSGTFNIPQSGASNSRVVGSGYVAVGHDSEGYQSGFANNAYINASAHSNIGKGGSGDAWVDAPRIPKPPISSPATPYADAITSGSMRINWNVIVDDRGAALDHYLLRVSRNSNPNIQPFNDYVLSPNETQVSLLELGPNETYYFQVYPHNSQGYGGATPVGSGTTLAGVYVSDGANWVPTSFRASDGSAWSGPLPQVSTGSAWSGPTTPLGAPVITGIGTAPGTTNANVNFTGGGTGTKLIQYSTSPDFSTGVVNVTVPSGASNSSYLVSGLASNTDYWFRMKQGPITAAGFWSNIVKIKSTAL